MPPPRDSIEDGIGRGGGAPATAERRGDEEIKGDGSRLRLLFSIDRSGVIREAITPAETKGDTSRLLGMFSIEREGPRPSMFAAAE